MPPTRLMLLWHMHQPYYKDLVENRYSMPWVRLHTLKDYFGMAAMIQEFPAVHMTFNLVPSLVTQILDYANGVAREESYELAFKSAASLTASEKETFVKYAFQLNHENLLRRYPRFWELFQKSRSFSSEPQAAPLSTLQDILDLQVLSQLAWFDEIYLLNDAEIKSLAQKQRSFTEADKKQLQDKETELCKVTLEVYRKAAERGQIELSTSPFYHPILPLLCDTNVAAESVPGLHLPEERFRHPEDARAQLQEAVKLHERVFGMKPRGLWPSEGSVSEEVLTLAAEEGFAWVATDEAILGRSLRTYFHRQSDGTVHDGSRLYQPYRFMGAGRPIDLFFRDHQLSDLIGFVYSRMNPEAAAHDLADRIRAAARSTGGQPAVISIILDGENAWEYYPSNGREFLKRFYALLASEPDIEALTPSEILAVTEPARLERLVPGSWINGNFNIWIGAEEDNRAWDLLKGARDFFEESAGNPEVDAAQAAKAREELWIAEGSDWCWWYGPEHSTANDEEFDILYRKHLSNIYRLLDSQAPDELAVSLMRRRAAAYNVLPTALISPVIDGRQTTYFEWLGAGACVPDQRSASLHASSRYIREVFYGRGEKSVYLRVDLLPEFLEKGVDFELRVNIGNHSRFHALISSRTLIRAEFWREGKRLSDLGQAGVRAAFENIFELGLDDTALEPNRAAALQVSLWVDRLPVQAVPREGWLRLELTEELVSW